jgi:hypothetical protein
MLAIFSSALSILWVGLAFGLIPLPDDPDGKGRLVLVVAIDMILFILGVIALVRAMRHRRPWLIASVIIAVPVVHWIGSLIGGEFSILFFLVPAVLLVTLTLVQEVRNIFMQRPHAP